ncbi:BTB/POZ domain-containing protein 2 isoform 2-T2 [Dama dama]
MAAGGSGGRASCPPGVGPGAGGGPGASANAAPAPGNAAAAAAASAPAVPGPPPPVSVSGPGAQAAAGGERAAEEPGAAALLREPVYNWQATKPTVKERFAFLFNNEVLCDVHFLVGKGLGAQRIPAHRFVLAVGSAVFDAMFNGGMATTSTEIELPDVEPAAFLALLKFLYSDEVQIGPETVMTTLYTAKKYAVPALEAHCVEFLKKNLRADNAFMLLTQARLFDEPQLASLCLENIDKNTADAITAEGFTDIDLDTLVAVLERDTLGIREVRLFTAVVRWSEAECQRQQLQVTPENKRKVLGKALALIRFPLMTIEEFAAGPCCSCSRPGSGSPDLTTTANRSFFSGPRSRGSWWTVRSSASSCTSPSTPSRAWTSSTGRAAVSVGRNAASTASSRWRAAGVTAALATASGSRSTNASSWSASGSTALSMGPQITK